MTTDLSRDALPNVTSEFSTGAATDLSDRTELGANVEAELAVEPNELRREPAMGTEDFREAMKNVEGVWQSTNDGGLPVVRMSLRQAGLSSFDQKRTTLDFV